MRRVWCYLLRDRQWRSIRRMRALGVGKAELARRLNCHLPPIPRLLDLRHGSRLDQMEQAFLRSGKRLNISIEDAA
jgi:antitoxin HicB